jgi:hypothetical protein
MTPIMRSANQRICTPCSQKTLFSTSQPLTPTVDPREILSRLAEVRCVEEEAHEHTAESAGNGDGHDPGGDEQADTLPVDGLVGAVAETNADGGTGNAHGRRYGKGVLREDEDGDGRSHLHAAAARRRVVGDLVTHDYENCQFVFVLASV